MLAELERRSILTPGFILGNASQVACVYYQLQSNPLVMPVCEMALPWSPLDVGWILKRRVGTIVSPWPGSLYFTSEKVCTQSVIAIADVGWITVKRRVSAVPKLAHRHRVASVGGAPPGATLGRAPLRGAAPWGVGRRESSPISAA